MQESILRVALTPATRGETGYRSLVVAVSGGAGYVEGASIRFEMLDGTGALDSKGNRERTAVTDFYGLADVFWTADRYERSHPHAQVEQFAMVRATTEDARVQRLDLRIG